MAQCFSNGARAIWAHAVSAITWSAYGLGNEATAAWVAKSEAETTPRLILFSAGLSLRHDNTQRIGDPL